MIAQTHKPYRISPSGSLQKFHFAQAKFKSKIAERGTEMMDLEWQSKKKKKENERKMPQTERKNAD